MKRMKTALLVIPVLVLTGVALYPSKSDCVQASLELQPQQSRPIAGEPSLNRICERSSVWRDLSVWKILFGKHQSPSLHFIDFLEFFSNPLSRTQ
jgi:hypothetical protein